MALYDITNYGEIRPEFGHGILVNMACCKLCKTRTRDPRQFVRLAVREQAACGRAIIAIEL
jgi:hypothetical protein